MAITVLTEASAGAPTLNGTAGSLISVLDYCLVTTLGWTKAFSGTNLAAYKQPANTNGFYLYVDDTSAQNARWRGFETMSALNVGTGLFPTDAQLNGGQYIYKSTAASSAAVPWTFVSNGGIFYLFRDSARAGRASAGADWRGYVFGDILSYKTGDTYNTILIGDAAASETNSGTGGFFLQNNATLATSAGSNGASVIARNHTQLGSSTIVGKFTGWQEASTTSYYLGVGTMTYPNPIDGQLYMSPIWISEAAGRRGILPGVWFPSHGITNFVGGDTFTGSGALAGRTFLVVRNYYGTACGVIVETSDTWGT